MVTAVALLSLAASATVFELPLKGGAAGQPVVEAVQSVAGVRRVTSHAGSLHIDVREGGEVRIRDVAAAIRRVTPLIEVDGDRMAVSPFTIFEINAGQCFFCAEKPIGHTLSRQPFVKTWAVVDYMPRGRLRFRIEPARPVKLEALAAEAFEDVILTTRYAAVSSVDLYWPTGGIEWRPDEPTARREATASRKPLMIFPTAGT